MTSWMPMRIRDVAVTFDGPHATPKSPKTNTAGPVFLGISSLQEGRLDLTQSGFLSEEDFAAWTRRVTPRAGDVVFSYETRLGQVAMIPDGLRCALGRRLALMRPDTSKVDPRFLLYTYLGPKFQEVIRSNTVQGSTVDRIMLTDFPDFPIDVPPLEVQRGIAATLGALDDTIESNRRIAALSLQLAECLYLTALDRGSRTLPLKDVGSWLSGGTPSTSEDRFWGGDFPWISASSLKNFFVDSSDRGLTEAGVAAATNIVPAGSILFVVRGMSLKSEFRLGVAQRQVAFGQDCKAIVPTVESSVLAVALLSMRNEILDLVDEAGHGTGRLQTDLLEQLPVRIPTDPEIVGALDVLLSRGARARQANAVLASIRNTLLPELLSGGLRVDDADAAVEAIA